jgi:hypothetical protein
VTQIEASYYKLAKFNAFFLEIEMRLFSMSTVLPFQDAIHVNLKETYKLIMTMLALIKNQYIKKKSF